MIVYSEANYECMELDKKVVEKQIPKKVLAFPLDKEIKYTFECPSCGKSVIGSGFYCWNCGQHLDWDLNS